MKEKTARNHLIYIDKNKGLSWRKLVQKYDLSIAVLRVIVARETLKERNK